MHVSFSCFDLSVRSFCRASGMNDDDGLTEYNRSIRKAFNACQQEYLRSTESRSVKSPMMNDNRESKSPRQGVSIVDKNAENCVPALEYEDVTPESFLRDFVQPNRPCLIHHPKSFRRISDTWSTPAKARDWFHKMTIGSVPVRRQVPSSSNLDGDGRAQECETVMMSMNDWIAHLDDKELDQERKEQLYLKDWHLQSFIAKQYQTHEPLYQVPDIFPKDILNAFLNEFDIGDYRFVYWGPKGSSTLWHSDVMNSYSWSYNVYGTKKWDFAGGATLIQEAGDLVFVPSELRHCVLNLEETLSINHNWVSFWNVPLVWDCMKGEIMAIEKELDAWDIDTFEARENMLRGCFGLDMTSLVMMMVWNCMRSQHAEERMCLRKRLLEVLEDSSRSCLHLENRLTATLSDTAMADETMGMIRNLISVDIPVSQHVETTP